MSKGWPPRERRSAYSEEQKWSLVLTPQPTVLPQNISHFLRPALTPQSGRGRALTRRWVCSLSRSIHPAGELLPPDWKQRVRLLKKPCRHFEKEMVLLARSHLRSDRPRLCHPSERSVESGCSAHSPPLSPSLRPPRLQRRDSQLRSRPARSQFQPEIPGPPRRNWKLRSRRSEQTRKQVTFGLQDYGLPREPTLRLPVRTTRSALEPHRQPARARGMSPAPGKFGQAGPLLAQPSRAVRLECFPDSGTAPFASQRGPPEASPLVEPVYPN